MKEYNYTRIIFTIFVLGLLFESGCEKNSNATGFLDGKISIGPLCPVEKIPPDPGCLPTAETYKAYPVNILSANGRTRITQIQPALDGSFNIELVAGEYLVVLDRSKGTFGSSNLPLEISVNPGDTTNLTINIDTGIR